MRTTKIDHVKNAEARIDKLEAEGEVFDQKTIKAVIRQNARLLAQVQDLDDENEQLKDASRHLARVNRMIPISEKKPTRKDLFLCQINDDHSGSAFRSRWFEGNKFDTDDVVVAWCELPEPYQETK